MSTQTTTFVPAHSSNSTATPSPTQDMIQQGIQLNPDVDVPQTGPYTVTDSDSDASEELANRPLDPGDDMYRGKPSSCVVSVSEHIHSPMRTRGRGRRAKTSVISSPVDDTTAITHSKKRRSAPTQKSNRIKKLKQHITSGKTPPSRNEFVDDEALDEDSMRSESALVIDNFE
ncbi:hypothetical protein CVT24_009467 [Panaeolus cyanescens]|uniref:Uncharacterized protein n=1 Tax=Panaeolus cyanescens TaxID=181874 RepID=A0A409WRP7_9AGAR|nr:hypothetical protein CVT24_009467 [Panaeolus cyanescens]